MVQLIDKQGKIFRLKIGGKQYSLSGMNLWADSIIPLPLKLKGSTLGWNTKGRFVSYRQIKRVIIGNNEQ